MERALVHVNLNLPKEYQPLIHEIAQVIVLFTVVHILRGLDNTSMPLFNEDFFKTLIFAILGFSFYYLIFKKVVRFVYEDEPDHEKETGGFYSTFGLF